MLKERELRFVGIASAGVLELPAFLRAALGFDRLGALVVGTIGQANPIDPEVFAHIASVASCELSLATGLARMPLPVDVVGLVPTGRFDDPEVGVYVIADQGVVDLVPSARTIP